VKTKDVLKKERGPKKECKDSLKAKKLCRKVRWQRKKNQSGTNGKEEEGPNGPKKKGLGGKTIHGTERKDVTNVKTKKTSRGNLQTRKS